MTRLQDILDSKNVADDAKAELKDAQQTVNDLRTLASLAESEGGKQLYEMLREDCRDVLVSLLNAKKAGESEKIMPLLSDFEAKFTLFNTLKSASRDYEDAEKALEERMEEILEG